MARSPRWQTVSNKHGMTTVTISSWKYFHDYFQEEFLDYRQYVCRGQSDEKWKLEPSINRFLKKDSTPVYEKAIKSHLENFKFSLRGRVSTYKELIQSENELWALGQHHGLLTPLLDFTSSPYVAAFFAFIDPQTTSEYRSIYFVSEHAINIHFKEKLITYKPLSDYNQRLISQSGLFIKFNVQSDIQSLFKEKYEENEERQRLFKIRIPNKDRELCLRLLNRMNINSNTLFPDINGASLHCNMELGIKNY